MKAISYFIAGAALLSGLVNSLDPAPLSTLPSAWQYKGCYTDQWFNRGGPSAQNQSSPAPYGVLAYNRTLNGYYTRFGGVNGAPRCVKSCVALNRGFVFAGVFESSCFCNTAIARNGSATTGGFPSNGWGVQEKDNTNCQQQCSGNPIEGCGTNNATSSRISLYEYAPVLYQEMSL